MLRFLIETTIYEDDLPVCKFLLHFVAKIRLEDVKIIKLDFNYSCKLMSVENCLMILTETYF